MRLSLWRRLPGRGVASVSEVPVRTVVAGMRWSCLAGSHGRLFGSGSPDWQGLECDDHAELVKENPLRRVYRVCWGELDLYVKVYRPVGVAERLKWRIAGIPAEGEFRRLLIARRRRVPVPRPVAWSVGRDKSGPLALLVTESLGSVVQLDELVYGECVVGVAHGPSTLERSERLREALGRGERLGEALAGAAGAVARMHCAGIEHRDLHCGNLMIGGLGEPSGSTDAWITDLYGCRVEQRGGHASADPWRRRRMANLGGLVAGLRNRLTLGQLEGFVEAYLSAIRPHEDWGRGAVREFLGRLWLLADRHDRVIVRRRDRRCLRNSRYSKEIRLGGGWQGRVFLRAKRAVAGSAASACSFTVEEWLGAVAEPGKLAGSGEVLKQGGRNMVRATKLAVGGTELDVVLKESRPHAGLRGCLQRLRPSRALRQWCRAHELIARHIPTAWPIAVLEHYRWGFLTQSVLITERIDGRNLNWALRDGELPSGGRERVLAARQLGVLLSRLSLGGTANPYRRSEGALGRLWAGVFWRGPGGFRHRDCKATNIMLRREGIGDGDGQRSVSRGDESGQYGATSGRGGPCWRSYLVDLDGLNRRWWGGADCSHEAIVRLAASVAHLEEVSVRDYVAVFGAYVAGLGMAGRGVSGEGGYGRAESGAGLPLLGQQQWRRCRQTQREERRELWELLRRKVTARAVRMQREHKELAVMSRRRFQRILIIKPSSLGDVVRSLPVLYALREGYPEAKISWLVRPDCAALLRPMPELDEIIEFDRKKLGKMWYRLGALRAFVGLVGELKVGRFDLVVDLQGLFRSGFLAYCTGAGVRMGFEQAREFAGWFYTDRVGGAVGQEHIVESYWRFAEQLGLGGMTRRYAPHVDEKSRVTVRRLLVEAGGSLDKRYAVLLVGGTEASKRWPTDRFAELAGLLASGYDMDTVLVGAGSVEAAAAEYVVQESGIKVVNLVDRTDLDEVVAAIADAAVVVGNDSGPLHIAAALGRPTVGLYGPTDPSVVGPYGQMDSVVESGVGPRRGRYSRSAEHRIEAISVAAVADMVSKKLIVKSEK